MPEKLRIRRESQCRATEIPPRGQFIFWEILNISGSEKLEIPSRQGDFPQFPTL